MPISIPTSIAGISVPGLINGPLQALYGNKFDFGTYRYPRNLGTDPTRAHVIRFTSLKPNGSPQPVSTAAGAANALAEGNFSEAAKKVGDAINEISAADVPRTAHATISLYIPDTVNVQYSNAYDTTSLTSTLGRPYFLAQAGTSLVDLLMNKGEMTAKFGDTVANDPYVRAEIARRLGQIPGVGGDLQPLALRNVGVAFNPQLQVLFQQTNFREFQFDFLFTPYSKEETETIRKIIQTFKFAAAPEIKKGSFGFAESLFVDVPYPFEIKFFYKGRENPYVHKIGRSVLQNVSVDYGPNGWATFNDGSPVQIRMSLQFTETVIVDKNRISEGY